MAGTGTTEREVVQGSAAGPTCDPALDTLALDQLRGYREELLAEEATVSYWRRLVQARLDLLLAERLEPGPGTDADGLLDRLCQVLTDVTTTRRRQAMPRVAVEDGAIPLPDLVDLWHAGLSASSDDDNQVLRRLADAERALSTYRKALHRRLDAATAELVARYAADPSRALVALPQGRTTTGLVRA